MSTIHITAIAVLIHNYNFNSKKPTVCSVQVARVREFDPLLMSYKTCATLKHATNASKLIPNLTKFQPHTTISTFSMASMVPTDLISRFFMSRQIFIYSECFNIQLNFLFYSHTKNCVDPILLPRVFCPPLVNHSTDRIHLRTHPID